MRLQNYIKSGMMALNNFGFKKIWKRVNIEFFVRCNTEV